MREQTVTRLQGDGNRFYITSVSESGHGVFQLLETLEEQEMFMS